MSLDLSPQSRFMNRFCLEMIVLSLIATFFIRKELLVRFQWTINVQLFCNLSQHLIRNFFSVLNSGGAKSLCASSIEGVTGTIGVELF